MESTTVTKTVFKHVKGSVPPELSQKLKENPDEEYEVIIQPMREAEEDANMPPEEKFRPEFVAEMEESKKDHEAGRYTECATKEESDAHFNKLINE